MANHTSRAVLESPPLSDIDGVIQRLLSELNRYIQELAQKTKEHSEAKESYCREKEAVRNRLFSLGIHRFDVGDMTYLRLQEQELERIIDEMLNLSDRCIAQIAKVQAVIDVKNKNQSSSNVLGGSKLGDSSTSNDDDNPLGFGQKGSVDLEIGKEDLENAQVILNAAELSIQDVKGLYVSASGGNVNGTEEESTGTDANPGGNRASASTGPNRENLSKVESTSEIECLESRVADFGIEEDYLENLEEMDVDSDKKIKLKRRRMMIRRSPKKAMKLNNEINPPARD